MKTNFSLHRNLSGLLRVFVLLSLLIGLPQKVGFASALFVEQSSQQETPKEYSDQEYQKEITAFYTRYAANSVVVMDLADPKGIDPKLLPADIAALVDSNTKVVAYKETIRRGANAISSISSMSGVCEDYSLLGIPCKSYDGTRDTTVSSFFGGIEQFSRVLALRYNGYSGCDRLCGGWEFEKQWAKWNRTDSSWTADTARMRTYSTVPEDFCTEALLYLDYSSSWFTPTWYGNQTSWWSISGFPNIAYVPFPSAVSETQGDIRHYRLLLASNSRSLLTCLAPPTSCDTLNVSLGLTSEPF